MAKELQKPVLEYFKKEEFFSFKNNICGADLANMPLITRFNRGIRFLLCVIGTFSKYAWADPLKDKKGVIIVNAFQNILKTSTELHSKRKPNKIWVNKDSEFYNK